MGWIEWFYFFIAIQIIHGLGTWKLYKKTGRWDNSKTDTVKYAGELIIVKGKLKEWNNISGHYMPPLDEASDTGLMMDKFKPFFWSNFHLFTENERSSAPARAAPAPCPG